MSIELPGTRFGKTRYRSLYAVVAIFGLLIFTGIGGYSPFTFICWAIVYISVGLLIWIGFLSATKNIPGDIGKDLKDTDAKQANLEEKAWQAFLHPLRFLWFWMLTIGLYTVLLRHFIDFYNSGQQFTLLNYFFDFIRKRSLDVFAVILAVVLTDFVLHLFQKFHEFHSQVDESAKNISGALVRVTPAVEGVGVATRSIEEATEHMEHAASRIEEVSIYVYHLMEKSEKEATFYNLLRNDETKLIGMCYEKSGRSLNVQVIDALSNYIAENTPDPGKWCYTEKKIVTSFITQYFKGFINGENNRVQANFGIMASIVNELYSAKEELYEDCLKKHGKNVKIVYFTTLTMPLDKYLEPRKWAGSLQSIVHQWDDYRRKTRKAIYRDDKGEVQEGHMWSFCINPNMYEFKRCCLWLSDTEKPDEKHGDIGIICKEEWKKATEYKPEIFEVLGILKPTNIDGNHPDFLDKLYDEPFTNPPEKRSLDVFKKLYHPKEGDCCGMEISSDTMYTLFTSPAFSKYSGGLKNAFKHDENWNKLITNFSKREEHPQWYKVFFQHIPLDIFAIGVRIDNNSDVDWKGCLSGFIGGDFNSMELGWDDDYISPEEWKGIRAFIDFLYDKAVPIEEALK